MAAQPPLIDIFSSPIQTQDPSPRSVSIVAISSTSLEFSNSTHLGSISESSDGPTSTLPVMSGVTPALPVSILGPINRLPPAPTFSMPSSSVVSTPAQASNPSNTSSTLISTTTVDSKGNQGRDIPVKLIAGSTAGFALGLILLVSYAVWWSRRRRKLRSLASRPKMDEVQALHVENMSTLDTPSIPMDTGAQYSAGDFPRVTSPSEVEQQVDEEPMSPIIIRIHDDSGFRLPHGRVLDLPPAYTPD